MATRIGSLPESGTAKHRAKATLLIEKVAKTQLAPVFLLNSRHETHNLSVVNIHRRPAYRLPVGMARPD